MSNTVRQRLAEIPGWEDAEYSALTGGITNTSWLIELDDRKAVLKIDEVARSEPFNSRFFEAQLQNRCAQQGLANRVIFVSETLLLTEYLDGVVWSAGCFDVDENLAKLAAAMKKLHAQPLAGRSFDAAQAAKLYARHIGNRDPGTVRDCLAKIESMPLPHKLCCCHNDLVAANIIDMPEVRFLDWEYACDNDPLFDIATVVAHHKLAPERAEYLLDAYFDGDGRRWRGQLARQTEFYDALCWLWEAASSPGVA